MPRPASAFSRGRPRETAFVVTQNEVLDAQVIVEAAHRSAQKNGITCALARSDDLAEYKALCARHGLFAASQ
jgi:hypothetical protein